MLVVNEIDLYYGASQALRKVDIVAEKGKVTCILGRNGVGKSSLARAIAGRHPIRGGNIMWEDKNISTMASSSNWQSHGP